MPHSGGIDPGNCEFPIAKAAEIEYNMKVCFYNPGTKESKQ